MEPPFQFPVTNSIADRPTPPHGATIPKDAAAVVLLRHNANPEDPEVFLVRRSEKMAFLGGYHAFPGGQFDSDDAAVSVQNCNDAETATAISCAARELFEETQVLVARGGDALTQGQRASLLAKSITAAKIAARFALAGREHTVAPCRTSCAPTRWIAPESCTSCRRRSRGTA